MKATSLLSEQSRRQGGVIRSVSRLLPDNSEPEHVMVAKENSQPTHLSLLSVFLDGTTYIHHGDDFVSSPASVRAVITIYYKVL